MDSLEADLEQLELAMRSFYKAMKRPQRWNAIVELSGYRIDLPGAMIIQILRSTYPDGCRVQDLAHQLSIEAPSVTRKTQELEKDGYVDRLPDPNDKRAVSIVLTTAGEAAGAAMRQAQRTLLSSALQDWDSSDRTHLATLLQRLSDDLMNQMSI